MKKERGTSVIEYVLVACTFFLIAGATLKVFTESSSVAIAKVIFTLEDGTIDDNSLRGGGSWEGFGLRMCNLGIIWWGCRVEPQNVARGGTVAVSGPQGPGSEGPNGDAAPGGPQAENDVGLGSNSARGRHRS